MDPFQNKFHTGSCIMWLLVAFCIGCKKDKDKDDFPHTASRMVLVYIAANNDLQIEGINSIKKMEAGANALNGVLLAYVKTNATRSYLLKIKHNTSNRIISDTLKVYQNENSSDPDFMERVITDSRQLCPAESYGLVLWSHATSWAPPSNRVKPESFGYDDGKEMDIKELKRILPDDFEYIMFDACSMGSIEVSYELKDKARYILASPAEILSTGFPYEEITPYLFRGEAGLKVVSEKFIGYYNTLSDLYASATISLIDTRELEPLARYTKALLDKKRPGANFNIDLVQRLNFQEGSGVAAYDFISFLEQNYLPSEYDSLKNQIGRAILYKGHTKNFFDIPIKTYSGLSVYLPVKDDPLQQYYSTFSWYHAGGWNNVFL